MELLALSHLVLSGAQPVGGLARLLGVSTTYASLLAGRLQRDGLVVKERAGKRVVVRPNMESPFVRAFSGLAVAVGAYPPFTPPDFLEPASRRRVLRRLAAGDMTIRAIEKATGYSRTTIIDALGPFLRTGAVKSILGRSKSYRLDMTSPLAERVMELVERLEPDIGLRPLLEKISSDPRVVAASVFGSAVSGRKDDLSDIDLLVVVGSPDDIGLSGEYAHPGLQLNTYSRRGLAQLAVQEPWFLRLALDGKVLKGKELLSGLDRLPAAPDATRAAGEVRTMLDGLGALRGTDRARVLAYCIRTAVAMRLYYEGILDQKRFDDGLRTRYPEFVRLRRISAGARVAGPDIRRTRTKVLEDLKDVEKREKEGAEKLEAQARAHEALYGSGWKEVTGYRKQALEIMSRHRLRTDNGRISGAALKLFSKRLEEFRSGKRRADENLPFMRLLGKLARGKLPDFGDGAEVRNLRMLEGLGFVKNGSLTGKGRELLRDIRSRD